MEKLDNIVDLGYDTDQVKEPFTMAFCYPREGPILIKGSRVEVLTYMETNLSGVYHYRLAHWRKGRKRGSWHVNSPPTQKICLKEIRRGSEKNYELQFLDYGDILVIAQFETIPHEYIQELDIFQIGG